MAKRLRKTRHTLPHAVETCTGRDSDLSAEEISEDESYISEVDSVTEEMFIQGRDIVVDKRTADSDADWEPSITLAHHTEQTIVSDSDAELGPSFKAPRMDTSTGRGRGRGRGRGASARQPETPLATWYGVDHPDVTPTQPIFRPARDPGCQLIKTANYSVLQLFQLFFSDDILLVLVQNTNQNGQATQNTPSQPWRDVTRQEMFSFLAIVVYMGFVKATALTDYWRKGDLYNFGFPRSVMTGKRFLAISNALHLSSAEDDNRNEARRGTASFDRLGKIKPLYSHIQNACRNNYQPHQHICVDERKKASKARVAFKQYIRNKPVRWGFKLFVLADSCSGYTWDFFVYEGKNTTNSGKGLSYDSVMKLVNTSLLGTGYKLYVDNFYTSPTLFRDLFGKKIWSCGTVRASRTGCPKTTVNALDQKSSRGSIRWIREGALVFLQWRDTRDVFLCSTIHTAHDGGTVQWRMKDNEGHWMVKEIPIPPAVKDYNKHMGGVDLSDLLISYYDVLHKTKKWYKTFFYHFLDIAIVNAFILHKDICKAKGQVPMHQKAFRETLALELAQKGKSQSTPQREASRGTQHRLVLISGDRTAGRRKCRRCHAQTGVKCATCDTPLCFVPGRDCYNAWHKK